MELIFTYALIVCGCLILFLCLGFRAWLIQLYESRIYGIIFRQLVYPFLYQRLRFLAPVTRLRALILASYCIVTFLYNAYNVSDLEQASTRAGWLSVINTIPLLMSGRLAMASKIFGLSLNGVLVTHTATGTMVSAQALAHVVLELSKTRLLLEDRIQLYGFMVRGQWFNTAHLLMWYKAAVALAVLIATLWLRRPFFEMFAKTHAMLALFAVTMIWLHLRAIRGATWQYAALSVLLYTVMVMLQILAVIFQNLIQQRRGARAYVSLRGRDGIVLTLNLEKAINAKPGQFIYVWMACSPLQTHPFMVISEDENTLSVLIQSQSGFSRKLKSIAEISDSDTPYLAWVDGPYGSPPEFGHYSSVVLVANGIGVAAHLSVLKSLLSGYQERSVKVRSIIFYWQIDNSGTCILPKARGFDSPFS